MRVPKFIPTSVSISALTLLAAVSPVGADELTENFSAPPIEYHPRVWWHWMNATVSKDGITKDLEAMQRIGLKGAQIFYMGAHREEQNGKELILSETWCDAVDHAAKESARLGLKLGTSGGEGCSGSGGLWITPEQSMQQLVWSEANVKGGASSFTISQPQTNLDFYKDITVLAFPSIAEESKTLSSLKPKITSDIPEFQAINWSAAIDGNPSTFAEIPKVPHGKPSAAVTFEFTEPITVRSLELDLFEEAERRQVKIAISSDGQKWQNLGHVMHLRGHVPHGREIMINGFAPKEAKFIKLDFVSTHHKPAAKLYKLSFQPLRIPSVHPKSARMRGGLSMSDPSNIPSASIPADQVIAKDKIINLSNHHKNGKIDYQLPAGNWTVVRFGHTSKGNKMKPAAPQSAGLEVDKMDPAHIEKHFKEGMLGQMADRFGDLTGSTFNCVNLDSWEAGCQTWTRHFDTKFKEHHGYDCHTWLLTVTGRVVDSLDLSDRFLWDYRNTVSDLIIDGYYKTLQRLCSERGMMLEAEAPGTGMPIIIDAIKALGTLDICQGEFWLGGEPHPIHGWKGGNDNTKEPACAAHVYGKEIVSCEAFTSFGHHDGWTQTPYTLKPWADRQFCKGMNEIVVHCSAHQPDDRAPGQTLGQFGVNFHRHLTWWEQGKAWVDYLSRCQYLLRQGRFHADVIYYYGEDSPASAGYFVKDALDPRKTMKPVLPLGYDYDACDLTIVHQMSVDPDNGFINIPSGMSYKYLVIPQSSRFKPSTLEKILQLANNGATIVTTGAKASRSPSLANYPKADTNIQQLAAKIWPANGKPATTSVGDKGGRIITGKSFETILAEDKLVQDFAFSSDRENPELTYIHRHLPGNEHLYFLSNQKEEAETITATFRVTGLKPELWNPVTGKKSAFTAFDDNGETTTVSLPMSHFDSAFIVFKKESTAPAIASASSAVGNTIDGAWNVSFQENRGGPAEAVTFDKLDSLTNHADPAIKYFSGTVTYKKNIQIEDPSQSVTLDLGQVNHVAEVFLNEKPLGILWKPPFTVSLDSALKGENKLEIRVTNVWKNRLVGDSKLPVEKRVSYSNYNFYPNKPNQPEPELVPSGLLGPVKLSTAP